MTDFVTKQVLLSDLSALETKKREILVPLEKSRDELENRLYLLQEEYDTIPNVEIQEKQIKQKLLQIEKNIERHEEKIEKKKEQIKKSLHAIQQKQIQRQLRTLVHNPASNIIQQQKQILKNRLHYNPTEVKKILKMRWQNKPSVLPNKSVKISFTRYDEDHHKQPTLYTQIIEKYPSLSPILSASLLRNKNKKVLFQDVEGIEKNRDWIARQVSFIKALPLEQFDLLVEYTQDMRPFRKGNNKKQLNRIFAHAPPLDHDLIVYRGIDTDMLPKAKRYYKTDRFVSTSILLNIAFGFMSTETACCLLQILLPKGTRCLFLPIISTFPTEMEILLSCETPFKILEKNILAANDSLVARDNTNIYPFQKEIIRMQKTSYWKYFLDKYLFLSL